MLFDGCGREIGKSGSTEGETFEEPSELVGGSEFGVGDRLGAELDEAEKDTAALELVDTTAVIVDTGTADMFVVLELSAPSPFPAFSGFPLAFTYTFGRKTYK